MELISVETREDGTVVKYMIDEEGREIMEEYDADGNLIKD